MVWIALSPNVVMIFLPSFQEKIENLQVAHTAFYLVLRQREDKNSTWPQGNITDVDVEPGMEVRVAKWQW